MGRSETGPGPTEGLRWAMGSILPAQPAVFQITTRVNRDEDGEDVVMWTEQWSL